MASATCFCPLSTRNRATLPFLVIQRNVDLAFGQLQFHAIYEPRAPIPRICQWGSQSCISAIVASPPGYALATHYKVGIPQNLN